MGVLDQVIDLKNQGVSEAEIINQLREQSVSPVLINDALSQAKIKKAVSAPENKIEEMEPSIMRPEKAQPLPTEGSAPSDAELTPPPSFSRIPEAAQRRFGPMTKEVGEEEYVPQPQGESYTSQPQGESYTSQPQPQYQYQQPQEYYPQQEYGYEYPAAGAGVGDTDTMIEISEQVFSEKVKAMQKQLEAMNEFKTLAQTKIDNISDRLKRIEMNIDRLQAAILEKVGGYGRGLESVKKEMAMMQGSFGKMVGSLAKKTEHSRPAHKTHTPTKRKTARKKTTSRKR